jgi:hypothetical protein
VKKDAYADAGVSPETVFYKDGDVEASRGVFIGSVETAETNHEKILREIGDKLPGFEVVDRAGDLLRAPFRADAQGLDEACSFAKGCSRDGRVFARVQAGNGAVLKDYGQDA